MKFPHFEIHIKNFSKKLFKIKSLTLQFQKPPHLEKHLVCIFLHHKNPFLQMGPFKFELKHLNPEIGYLHDFISLNEVNNIKNLARGNMRSTPYIVKGKLKSFSKDRTSKIMFMNERYVPEAMVISHKIELAMKFKLTSEFFASENYQVMNYGIGGKISSHVDTSGVVFRKNKTVDHFSQEQGGGI